MARKQRNGLGVLGFVEDPDNPAGDPGTAPTTGGETSQDPDIGTAPATGGETDSTGGETSSTGESGAGQPVETPAPAASPAGQKRYPTPNGDKTIAEMRQGLAGAGYNGPTDDASVIAAYNRTTSGSGARTSSGFADLDSAYQKLIDAAAQGNQAKFDEAKREFDLEYALKKQQFAETQRQNYANTALALLRQSSALTGPADYMQYQKNLAGGRELTDILRGSQPLSAFNAPSGFTAPMDIATLMRQLGIDSSALGAPPASGATAGAADAGPGTRGLLSVGQPGAIAGAGAGALGGAPGSYQPAPAPASGAPGPVDLPAAPISGQRGATPWPGTDPSGIRWDMSGGATDPVAQLLAAPASALSTPANAMIAASQPARSLQSSIGILPQPTPPQFSIGILPQPTPPPTADQARPASISQQMSDYMEQYARANNGSYPDYNLWLTKFRSITGASDAQAREAERQHWLPGFDNWVETNIPRLPLPHQMNPAVWDSLGPEGQKLALSVAASGYTQGGAYDPADYERLINAARPRGRVGRTTDYNYQEPAGAF